MKQDIKPIENKVMKILRYRAKHHNTEDESELIKFVEQNKDELKIAIETTIREFTYWYYKDFINIEDMDDIDAIINILRDHYEISGQKPVEYED